MSHLNKVIARVDATIEESVITHMNELLIELSDDAELSREDRYTQQQRLRTAIAHHGKQHKEEAEARHAHLTQGGTIPGLKLAPCHQPRQPPASLRRRPGQPARAGECRCS